MPDSPWAVIRPADTAGREPAGTTPGSEAYPAGEGVLAVKALDLSWAWGAQPASARLTYTAQISDPAGSISDPGVAASVAVGTYLPLYIGQGATAYLFHGVCQAVTGKDSSRGKERELVFADLRLYLGWDVVKCVFNKAESRLVLDPGTGTFIRQRRWAHQYPGDDFANGLWTFTDAPLTAAEICDELFAAPTVGSPWLAYGPQYHPDMFTRPVFELDWSAGQKLDAALLEVSERLGLQFTLAGYYVLRWRRKGEVFSAGPYADPVMPWAASPFPVDGVTGRYVFPPGANGCEDGWAVASAPTRVLVTGDRDLYQVLNLELVKDWASGWETFWDFDWKFQNWVCAHVVDVAAGFGKTFDRYPEDHPEDPENIIGRQRGWAYAASLTVREAAAMFAAAGVAGTFLDTRKLGGRSRAEMPVKLYLEQVLWRAYRLPDTILGKPARTWELRDSGLVQCTHDAAGVISPDLDGDGGFRPVDGSGYAIAKGYAIGTEALRSLNPDRFDLAEWTTRNLAWTPVSFNLDPGSGDQAGFILFDQPIIDASDAYVMVAGDTGKSIARLNHAAVITAVPVRAALTMAGPRYQLTVGTGSKDAALNEPGLFRELVYDAGGTYVGEVGYLDGETPETKATALANTLLTGQTEFRFGGFEVPLLPGDGGISLNGGLERLGVSVSGGGVKVSVSFATERASRAAVPPRQFDRAVKEVNLYPGQAELRATVGVVRAFAAGLKQNPGALRNFTQAFHDQLGDGPRHPVQVAPPAGGWADGTTFAAGTPLWRLPTATKAVASAETTAAHTVLAGVVTGHVAPVVGVVPCGLGGRVLVRALGPVAPGDALGRRDGHDHLIKDGGNAHLVARGDLGSGVTGLVWADFGGGGGGTGTVLWD